MRENFTLFGYTMMIVFFALSTAFYAVLLWLFALLPIWIIPAITSLRPGNAVPIVCSLLWGPAAAWGTAFGNLIGYDIMGGALTLGSIGGFVGNWVMGFLPYFTWHKVFGEEPHCRSTTSLAKFEATNLLHSSACGMVISLWVELIGFVPFAFISIIITFNNFLHTLFISPILMGIFYPRVKRMGWLWTDFMSEYSYTTEKTPKLTLIGYGLIWIGWVIGNFICIGLGLAVFGQMNPFGTGGWVFAAPAFSLVNPIFLIGLLFSLISIVGIALMEFGGKWRKAPS